MPQITLSAMGQKPIYFVTCQMKVPQMKVQPTIESSIPALLMRVDFR